MDGQNSVSDCEKQRLITDEPDPRPAPRQPPTVRDRLVHHVFPCLLLLLSTSILFRKVFVCHHHYTPSKYLEPHNGAAWTRENDNSSRVALEAHIMSRCPDAAYCLQELVVPVMAQVSDKVDFELSYIGSIDHDSGEVHCMHGPEECLGNMIELCAAYKYPEPVVYLGFANCLTAQYADVPKRPLVEACAMEHGIDFDELNKCISSDGQGESLLRDSIRHSQEVGVKTSCTVRIEGEVYCVRDGGKWKDCPGGSDVRDLVADIELLYAVKNLLG